MELLYLHGTLSEKGLSIKITTLKDVVEKPKSYILNSGMKQISKSKMKQIDSLLHNNLNTPILQYYAYCLSGDKDEVAHKLKDKLIEQYNFLSDNLKALATGLQIYEEKRKK